jgi:hypothetical protein
MPESTQNAEASSSKIDLTLPGFREDSGKIFIPPTVRHVEKQLRNERILLLDPLPIQGLESFLDVGNKLAYGAESPAYRKERVCLISPIMFAKADSEDMLSTVLLGDWCTTPCLFFPGSISAYIEWSIDIRA